MSSGIRAGSKMKPNIISIPVVQNDHTTKVAKTVKRRVATASIITFRLIFPSLLTAIQTWYISPSKYVNEPRKSASCVSSNSEIFCSSMLSSLILPWNPFSMQHSPHYNFVPLMSQTIFIDCSFKCKNRFRSSSCMKLSKSFSVSNSTKWISYGRSILISTNSFWVGLTRSNSRPLYFEMVGMAISSNWLKTFSWPTLM